MADLEADSLDAVEIIMALEDEFGVEIPDEEAENFKNIGDIYRFIQSKKAE
jgi:acyl carrier protein